MLDPELERIIDQQFNKVALLEDLEDTIKTANAQMVHELAKEDGEERSFDEFLAAFTTACHDNAAKIMKEAGVKSLGNVYRAAYGARALSN